MNYKEYMNKVGVSKKTYVENWLANDLIPGVVGKEDINTAQFPDSARRPYACGGLNAKTDAAKIRGHIVRAAIMRRHISAKQCFMSPLEFSDMIDELVRSDLIRIRVEDEITYYDSTLRSDAFANKRMEELREFVLGAIEAASKGAVEGLCEAAKAA